MIWLTTHSREGRLVSPASFPGRAQTSDPPASAFLERRLLKQEGSLAHPVNGSAPITDVPPHNLLHINLWYTR
jgi:hypothetical protein